MKKRILLIVLAVLAIAGGGYGAWETWGVKAEAPKSVAVQTSSGELTLGSDKGQESGQKLSLPDTAPKSKEIPKVADIIKATNVSRTTNGLAPLTESALLDKSACLKANDMIAKNYWAHVSPDGIEPWYWIQQVGYTYASVGENLAYGFNTGNQIVTAWMNSQTHKDNVLGNYTEVGVCVIGNVQYQGGENSPVVAHYGRPQ